MAKRDASTVVEAADRFARHSDQRFKDLFPNPEDDGYDGGEPPGGDMEQRVRQLETDMSYIKGKLEDMPTKDWVTTRLVWVVLAIGTISAFIEAAGRLIP